MIVDQAGGWGIESNAAISNFTYFPSSFRRKIVRKPGLKIPDFRFKSLIHIVQA